ncbi:MAG: molybdopterin-dependent oxidoreductase [Gammaproteobacteria bacterium]
MPSPLWLFALIPLSAAGILLLRGSSGLGLLFRHGRWPVGYARSHAVLIILFPLLMVSGVGLYLQAWHRALLPWLRYLEHLHVWLGLAFAAIVLVGTGGLLGRPRRGRWFDWSLTGGFTALTALSGFALWLPGRFPASWDAVAFTVHGLVSYVWLTWLLVHAALRAFSFQRRHPLNARFDFGRRDALIGAAGTTLASAGVLSLLGQPSAPPPAAGNATRSTSTNRRSAQVRFPSYYTYSGDFPNIDGETFRLRIDGLVEHPIELTLAQLRSLHQTQERRVFTCVTGWSVPNVLWTGVRPERLLELVGARPEATHLIFHSADGIYVDQLTVKQARLAGVLLAHSLDGSPLPRAGGYPLRLVVPPMYGYKSVKWVNRIVVADQGVVGTWERYGYADDAWIDGTPAGA